MSESRFRWVGRPSEEELLGLRAIGRRRASGFPPASPRPAPRPSTAVSEEVPRDAIRARSLVGVAVVAAAIGLAFGVAQRGLGSESPGPDAPTTAAAVVADSIALDRGQLTSIARERPTTARHERPAGAARVTADRDKPSEQPSADDGSTGSKDYAPTSPPPPPTETSEPPLLEANVPGIGRVTVEQPDLPDTDDVLSATETLTVGDSAEIAAQP